MKGIEIDGYAVALARLTLWMGHKLSVDELGLSEATLPLPDLSGIRTGDALRMEWPRADAIIGNPPFHGTKFMRSALGDDYVEWLRREFGVGVKDYCVYWFRKAHDHLHPGKHAGLVGTNSIAEGRNRQVSLDYIQGGGGVITAAVSNQNWPGEANVHVSIVNWVKGLSPAPERFMLDGAEVSGITTALKAGTDHGTGISLAANAGRQFFGVVPGGAGFILSPAESAKLLAQTDANYGDIVRPFLVGADIARNPEQRPTRFAIDFGLRSLEEAMEYPQALERIRWLVKPHRDRVRRKAYREKWWRFEEPIVGMRKALSPLSRFISCPAQSKRFYMIWCQPDWCPSNLTSVFAFEDDFSMGVLSSAPHIRWAMAQSTRLKSDPRYTSASFMTFPWPSGNRDEVADVARQLCAHRSEICLERQIGLTTLYNRVDDGAWADLRDLHRKLDEAVAAAYGWPRAIAHDPEETNRRLLELNRSIAAGEIDYRPFD